jgi:hypothetical protein
MSALLNTIFRPIVGFLASGTKRYLCLIAILAVITIAEFSVLGLARRTFVFYTINTGELVVEDRMLKKSPSREMDITRYTEETLLGPVSPDLRPLFPHGTKLKSLLYRHGVVYADFSTDALLPPEEGGSVYENFQTLYNGIKRNFATVREVRFFINGQTIYAEDFHEITVFTPENAPGSVQ